MKQGRTINELAQEITRQMDAKKDYVASTAAMTMEVVANDHAMETGNKNDLYPVLALKNGNGGYRFTFKETAHDQLAARLGIPKAYYDRMRTEAPALLAGNVNHWFQASGSKYMVRTLDGAARAFLSDRYRPLDNHDLMEAVLPAILKADLEIMSCQVTDSRLYLKAVDRKITRDVPTGRKMGDGSHVFFDTCSPAIIVSNSEIGAGSLSIETGVWTKVCTNLAISAQRSMRKYHVGGKLGEIEGFYELLTDQTKRLSDAAIWAQARDLVAAALDRVKFDAMVDAMAQTVERKITADPVVVLEKTAKRFGFTDGERGSVLRHLVEGGDLSQYGLLNAITRTAEDLPDYDRATKFERFGGEVIELQPHDWKELAVAA